jgi:hypothetical protein
MVGQTKYPQMVCIGPTNLICRLFMDGLRSARTGGILGRGSLWLWILVFPLVFGVIFCSLFYFFVSLVLLF